MWALVSISNSGMGRVSATVPGDYATPAGRSNPPVPLIAAAGGFDYHVVTGAAAEAHGEGAAARPALALA